ncbi:MAG: MinD/ParA family protein [Lachnospiraceae bacterium]|nr:MinD/ParA family protein [Lachnospiraceae bacterium]
MDQASKLRELIKSQNNSKTLARVITVTSGKGGVGKSSVSVNLALWLRRLGKRVVILDADFGLANIEVMLGIRPKYNLADLMFKGKALNDIITEGPEGIGFISGGSGIAELTSLTANQVVYLVQKLCELDQIADIIIIDTGAGISDNVLEFVAASEEVLLVATPEPTSITDAYALLKTLNKKHVDSDKMTVKMIANKVSNEEEGEELCNKLNIVVKRFLDLNLEFLGAVTMDMAVTKAVMQQKPFSMIYPNSPASKSIHEIAGKLCGQEVDISSMSNKGITRMFSGIIARINQRNSKK